MKKAAILVRPIHCAADYSLALKRAEQIFHAKPGTPEDDELEVLVTLIDAYESEHYPMDAPDPLSAIEFRMEQQGLTRKDLEPYIGSRARVSEVLSGKRTLTLGMIRRLHEGLKISADLLIKLPVRKRQNVATGQGRL